MQPRICAFLCLLFLLSGCLQKAQIPVFPPGENSTLAQAAQQAWQNKDYTGSGSLYQRLLATKDLPPNQLALAWQRMTYSALNCENYTMARTGVRGWETDLPQVRQNVQWLQAKFLVDAHFFRQEQQEEAAKDFLLRQDLNWPDKTKVIDFVFNRLWQEKRYTRALAFARLLYAFSPEYEQRFLQSKMIFSLQGLSLQRLQELTPQKATIFPDNCLAAVLAQRQLAKGTPATQRQAYEILRDLSHSDSWRGGFPFQQELNLLKKQVGRSRREIALLLPLSGGYARLSAKILQGVEIGLQFLFEDDFDTNVRIINSEADDWLEQVQSLPASVTFVGGPLQKHIWQKIVDKKLYQRYAFFTFLSQMEEEGQYGWRFFSSPKDQVRSLIKACNDRQPNMSFAILYPEERYGKEMSRIFWDELQKNRLQLKGMQAYTPGRHKSWGQAVRQLLGVTQQEEEKEQTGEEGPEKEEEEEKWQPDFDAVFLPDSLAAARQLVPGFFYNDANNLLFLGPQLWEEGLKTRTENRYFSNSLFPAAWWRKNPSYPARFLDGMLQDAQPDFWEALGFDFVRFFTRMPALPAGWHSRQLNSLLQTQAQKMDWTLAPLLWDSQGLVKQEMYIFRASSRQTAPLNPAGKQETELFQ